MFSDVGFIPNASSNPASKTARSLGVIGIAVSSIIFG